MCNSPRSCATSCPVRHAAVDLRRLGRADSTRRHRRAPPGPVPFSPAARQHEERVRLGADEDAGASLRSTPTRPRRYRGLPQNSGQARSSNPLCSMSGRLPALHFLLEVASTLPCILRNPNGASVFSRNPPMPPAPCHDVLNFLDVAHPRFWWRPMLPLQKQSPPIRQVSASNTVLNDAEPGGWDSRINPPATVSAAVADYQAVRPKILSPHYSDFLEGWGAGTVGEAEAACDPGLVRSHRLRPRTSV